MPTNDEMDDFWSIEKLIPKKKLNNGQSDSYGTHDNDRRSKSFATDIKCTEVSFGKEQVNESGDSRLSFLNMALDKANEKDIEYKPENNKFIKSVKILHLMDRYDFYGNFRKAALLYFDYKTEECDYIPFYSYMPQYSQMSTAQRNYYFFWRDQFKKGKYLKTDYSYICLLAFEIFNLSDKIQPKDGIKLLCRIWSNYRKSFTRMDADFSIWIQDYCLVHGLDAPYELVGEFSGDVIALAPFKEFWFSNYALNERAQRNLFLTAISEYDWRKGKYAAGSTKPFYEKHMLGAMGCVISDIWYSNDLLSSIKETKKIKRTAFPTSICTHSVKCTLEIEYYPISESALREKITQAVRYSENKLRALMGIKSRLAIKDMHPYYAHIIDKYFDAVYKAESEKRRTKMLPEYEKLYDAPLDEMSFLGASKIEESSWSTTARLVSDKETPHSDEELIPIHRSDLPSDKTTEFYETVRSICEDREESDEGTAPLTGISDAEASFLLHCLDGDLVAHTLENDSLAESINEIFLEMLGDVVIEATDEGYTIIEDYREDIERILKDA